MAEQSSAPSTDAGTTRPVPLIVRPATACYGLVMRGIHSVGWRRVRLGAGVVYFAVIAYIVLRYGVPTGRRALAMVVVAGLAVTCLGRGWRRLLQVVLDWLPFTLVLMSYDLSRGIADGVGMPLHERDIVDAEKWLFGGRVPTVWMQQHFYSPTNVHWYDALATLVYTSHFVVTPVLAAIFWLRDRAVWFRYISRVIVLAFAGVLTYVLFPEAPPWMASENGYIGPVSRLSARGWEYVHAGFAHRLLVAGQSDGSNPVAAMPSLHVAFATLAAVFLATRLRTRWRYLLVLYPIAMGTTLVYTGEHWVIDLVFGVLYAAAVHLALRRWERRRARRAEAAGACAPGPATQGLPGDAPVEPLSGRFPSGPVAGDAPVMSDS